MASFASGQLLISYRADGSTLNDEKMINQGTDFRRYRERSKIRLRCAGVVAKKFLQHFLRIDRLDVRGESCLCGEVSRIISASPNYDEIIHDDSEFIHDAIEPIVNVIEFVEINGTNNYTVYSWIDDTISCINVDADVDADVDVDDETVSLKSFISQSIE